MARRAPTKKRKPKSLPRKVMVIVHGGGSFSNDYYQPLVRAIEKALGRKFDYIPVYYADVPRAAVSAAAGSPAEKQFRADFENELRRAYQAAQPPGVAARAIPVEAFAFIAKELAQYFFDRAIRAEIHARVIAALDQAKRKRKRVVLVTLSLGTVIAFDVLKQFADRYKIALWFTCGSPLAKLRRVKMYDDSLGAMTSQNVVFWYNLYDDSDYVADPLGPAFPKPGYRLHDIFVNIGSGLLGSHDYWNNAETIKMLADAMR